MLIPIGLSIRPIGVKSNSEKERMTKKIVIIVTNHNQIGDTGKQTGWYLPEVAHPYHVFVSNGFKVDFASPLGGAAPVDEGSVKSFEKDKISVEFIENKEIQDQIQNSLKISDLKASDYVALFFAGGHGPMYDIPQHEPVQKLSAEIYENNGVGKKKKKN